LQPGKILSVEFLKKTIAGGVRPCFSPRSKFKTDHLRMGSIKKRRKSKINRHKRKKRMKLNRHKKRLRYKS